MNISTPFQEKKNLLIFAAALLVILAAGVYFYFSALPEESNLVTPPVIKEVSNHLVRIAWETEEAVAGSLYLLEGERERVISEEDPGRYHEISLTELAAETDYHFRLSQSEQTYYTFRTAPAADTAFRFLLFQREGFLETDWTDKFIETANSRIPDFAAAAGRAGAADYLEKERGFIRELAVNTPGLPVYLMPGGEVLQRAENREHYHTGAGGDYFFDFGNSRFIFLGPAAGETADFAYRQGWLEGVVARGTLLTHNFVILTHLDGDQLAANPDNTDNTGSLPAYLNELLSRGEIAAVFLLNCSSVGELLSGTSVYNLREGFMTVDVDGEGITGQIGSYQSPEMTEVVINDYPEAVKRSCVYCRKLIEKEKYQESIQWYRNFIADYGEEYMVDDSQFEIANIYDRYLYDYDQAVKEYHVLLNNYPDSNKIRQAKQRLEYLQSHSDHNYEPLRIFEKARMETYEEDPAKAAAGVEAILSRYPGSSLEPQLLEWLGRTLAAVDFDKSVEYLERLAGGQYGAENREEALIALGDTLYANMKYGEAIAAYKKAENETNSSALAGKLYRCSRNINRERLKLLALVITVILMGIAVLARPFLFSKNEIRLGGILGLFYLLAGLVTWKLVYTAYPGLLQFILALSIAGAVVPMAAAALVRKIFKKQAILTRRLLTGLTAVLLSAAAIYLVVYYHSSHYLVPFGL